VNTSSWSPKGIADYFLFIDLLPFFAVKSFSTKKIDLIFTKKYDKNEEIMPPFPRFQETLKSSSFYGQILCLLRPHSNRGLSHKTFGSCNLCHIIISTMDRNID
jgi:hypothetical protein